MCFSRQVLCNLLFPQEALRRVGDAKRPSRQFKCSSGDAVHPSGENRWHDGQTQHCNFDQAIHLSQLIPFFLQSLQRFEKRTCRDATLFGLFTRYVTRLASSSALPYYRRSFFPAVYDKALLPDTDEVAVSSPSLLFRSSVFLKSWIRAVRQLMRFLVRVFAVTQLLFVFFCRA